MFHMSTCAYRPQLRGIWVRWLRVDVTWPWKVSSSSSFSENICSEASQPMLLFRNIFLYHECVSRAENVPSSFATSRLIYGVVESDILHSVKWCHHSHLLVKSPYVIVTRWISCKRNFWDALSVGIMAYMIISNQINKYMENRRKIANKEKINTKLNKYIRKI